MCKAENSLSRLVHPLDDFSEEMLLIKQCLEESGFSKTDQEWLVEVFKRPDCFGDPTGDSVFNEEFTLYFGHILPETVKKFNEPVQAEKTRQTRLVFLLHALLGLGGTLSRKWLPNAISEESDNSPSAPEWVGKFQEHAEFSFRNLDWQQLKEKLTDSHFDDLLSFLLPERVPIEQIVDLGRLNPVPQTCWYSNDSYEPEDIEFWLTWRFSANEERCNRVRIDRFLPAFSHFPDDELGKKILGLLNAITNAMRNMPPPLRWEKRLDPLNDGWKVVARELIPFLELVDTQKPELKQERSPLLKAWWRLSKVIYNRGNSGLESELPEDLRKRLLESASRHIGILRSILRDTPEVFDGEDSQGVPVLDFYDKAFYVLLSFAPPWKRLKPLLLAFAEMQAQAVASHLSFWNEAEQENPPQPYAQIPLWIGISMYPQNLQEEFKRDPYLQKLREEFAKFCLERLRTRGEKKDSGHTNEDFKEPRPVWRGCYVQALKVLRANPGGRAHRTLFWLRNNDPDQRVREYAKRAHRQVRHLDGNKPNLDEGASPRRPLFEAFWWLRQAHLITLGIEVDQAGAMRTRRKELHRTRERDDRDN